MQAHGNVILPVVNMALAGGIRLLSVYILARNPKIGIVGAPISNLMCYVLIFLLNLLSIHHLYNDPPQILPNVLRPLLSGLLMGACAYGCYQAMLTAHIGSRLLLCAVPVSVGAIVYLAPVEAVILPASATPAAIPAPVPINAPAAAPNPMPAIILLPLLAATTPPKTAPTAAPIAAVIAKNGRFPVSSDMLDGLFKQYANKLELNADRTLTIESALINLPIAGS
jgi:hypothetical protein